MADLKIFSLNLFEDLHFYGYFQSYIIFALSYILSALCRFFRFFSPKTGREGIFYGKAKDQQR